MPLEAVQGQPVAMRAVALAEDGDRDEMGFGEQAARLRRLALDELRPQLERNARGGVVEGADPTPHAAAGFEYDDVAVGPLQLACGHEAGRAGPQHEHRPAVAYGVAPPTLRAIT
jgi:hypothetical protein